MAIWDVLTLGAGWRNHKKLWDDWDALPLEEKSRIEKRQEEQDNADAELMRNIGNQRR